jgi:hypothetical protein
VRHGCYTRDVPTKLPRHTITETPDVKAALDEVRHELGEDSVDFKQLLIVGANETARRVRTRRQNRQAELAQLAKDIFADTLVDLDAAEEARRARWVRGA